MTSMPELPEVETIVRELKKEVLNRTFLDVWTDFKKMIRLRQGYGGQVKKPFEKFKKEIKGKKIKDIKRKGKNILFELSGDKTLLIHQKLTGHLLLGKWKQKKGKWISQVKGPLADDPMNKFLHLIFWLDNRRHPPATQMLALSDLRKFAKVELWDTQDLKKSKDFKEIGPDPLEKSFTFQKLKDIFKNKRGKIKQVLMDQTVIAGIGNIYSDEILWEAKIHPFKDVSKLSEAESKKIYLAIKKILPLAVKLKGESISDYRRISGERGYYDKARKVYRKEGERCPRCHSIIKRQKIGGRSAYFCPKCQRR